MKKTYWWDLEPEPVQEETLDPEEASVKKRYWWDLEPEAVREDISEPEAAVEPEAASVDDRQPPDAAKTDGTLLTPPQPRKEEMPVFKVVDRRRFASFIPPQDTPEDRSTTKTLSPSEWPPAEAPQPESGPLLELQREFRRVGRELFKTARQAEANRQIFSQVMEEIQQLPSLQAEAVWQMKAGLLRELLGVVDGLEKSLQAGQGMLLQLEAAAATADSFRWKLFSRPRERTDAVTTLRQWIEGQEILYRRLMSILHSQGAQEIDSVGQRFDAQVHRATVTETRSDLPPGTVLAEEVKGYTLDGKILRYAEVVVSSHE